MADDLLAGAAKPYEKDRKKKQKKQARARVRCPYCWEALKLTENDDADQVVIAHSRKCWWLEKNGKGHAEIAERGLKAAVKEALDSGIVPIGDDLRAEIDEIRRKDEAKKTKRT